MLKLLFFRQITEKEISDKNQGKGEAKNSNNKI